MANHMRRQIREAAATALTGLTTTGSRVFTSRARLVQAADLPCLRIWCDDENISTETIHVARVRERVLQLVVEGCCSANADMDDTLDQIAKEVEIALDGNQTLGVGVKAIEPKEIKSEFLAQGETVIAVVTMRFEATYYAAKGAPDVAL